MNKKTKCRPNSKVWIKFALLVAIVFFTAALLCIHIGKSRMEADNKALEQQALELEEGNKDLQNYLDHKDTDEGVKDVATGELGMVDPDTVIYDFD